MKKYFADILTLMRFVLAISLIIVSFCFVPVGVGLWLFILAELTDAFDGTCARKWPFKKGTEPKYRKYAAKYDMIADALTWFAVVLFLTIKVNLTVGLSIMFGTAIICGVIELLVYGKLFGHPDDCTANSLCKKNFRLAKQIVMWRRKFYLLTIVFVGIVLLFNAEFESVVKITTLIGGILVLVFLWFFLAQRRNNISRNAEALEKKLLK